MRVHHVEGFVTPYSPIRFRIDRLRSRFPLFHNNKTYFSFDPSKENFE